MNDLFEYDEHDSGDGAGGSRHEGAEEGEDGDGESCPARVYAERSDKDGNETGACTCQEKSEHPVRGYSDKSEARDNVCRQGNWKLQVSLSKYSYKWVGQ